MPHYIVKEPSEKIRHIAITELTGKWKDAIIAFLIVFLVQDVVAMLLNHFFAIKRTINTVLGPVEQNLGIVGDLFTFAVGGAFSYGLALYLLTLIRTKDTNNSLVFEGFSRFGKVFLLSLIIGIKVFLWALLFIIPGIIAGIRYSMSYYVLADNPEYTATQCIEESKRIMNGNKYKYFCLTLSFIGWYILASIPSALMFNAKDTILSIVIAAILSIPLVAVDVYRRVAETVLYEMVNNNLVVSNGPVFEVNSEPVVGTLNQETPGSYNAAHQVIEVQNNAEPLDRTTEEKAITEDAFGAPIDEKDDL